MKTTTEIGIYEINEQLLANSSEHQLEVSSHWNDSDRVMLRWGTGPSITVVAEQLKKAVDRATR